MGDRQVNGRWERRHKFNDFGCTVCHDGQGRGLETFYAHGEDHYWPDPLLGYVTQENWRKEFLPHLKHKAYMEAACAQCHTEENFAGTPHVKRGRELFFATNCYGCHRIEGLSEGTLAPDLTEAGHKFKVEYLWESIVDPRANLATSFMPKFKLSDDDVLSLVVFLKSRRGINFNETQLAQYRARMVRSESGAPEVKPAVLVKEVPVAKLNGAEVIKNRACTACHKLGDRDGGIAPDLSFEGLVKDETWIYEHFRNPRSRVSDSIMPAFRLPDEEFRAMSAYLVTLKTPPTAMSPADTFKNLCARCHGEKGDGKGPIAYYLDPAPRDLTKVAFMTTKPRERLLKSIREGVAGTSMPAWGKALNEQRIAGILDWVKTGIVKEPDRKFVDHKIPAANPVASGKDSVERGENIFLARCTGCHGRKADGKGPNSLDIIPHPRNLRNSDFVQSQDDHRLMESILYGVQGTAMPPWVDYGLGQKDAGDLVNFIRSFNTRR